MRKEGVWGAQRRGIESSRAGGAGRVRRGDPMGFLEEVLPRLHLEGSIGPKEAKDDTGRKVEQAE